MLVGCWYSSPITEVGIYVHANVSFVGSVCLLYFLRGGLLQIWGCTRLWDVLLWDFAACSVKSLLQIQHHSSNRYPIAIFAYLRANWARSIVWSPGFYREHQSWDISNLRSFKRTVDMDNDTIKRVVFATKPSLPLFGDSEIRRFDVDEMCCFALRIVVRLWGLIDGWVEFIYVHSRFTVV